MTDADSTPTRASLRIDGSTASSTMKSEIVNPMPQSAAPPATRSSDRPAPNVPIRVSFMSAAEPNTPMNLPTTSAATMPQVSGEIVARARISGLSSTPALARANSGRMTKATYGAYAACSRSLIEIDSRRLFAAARAYWRVGGLLEGAGQLERLLDGPPVGPVHRDEQGHGDSGERGMHARGEEGEPYDDRQGSRRSARARCGGTA